MVRILGASRFSPSPRSCFNTREAQCLGMQAEETRCFSNTDPSRENLSSKLALTPSTDGLTRGAAHSAAIHLINVAFPAATARRPPTYQSFSRIRVAQRLCP
ncbi:predicted protein [Coccidioides posadasii str. Silveira]|uniref:Predicted protein n=1 Tax=Coccidioides posadasii (strain RMSCC 757 / Silveira) TaxID=443226 RepID=E9DDM9_COCPS|nr:predicted protein [Coccidioides posadasii str. Silveira]